MRCAQSLLLLSYLVRNGSERVVTSAREHLYDLRALADFTSYDEYGRDQGINGEGDDDSWLLELMMILLRKIQSMQLSEYVMI